MEFCVLPPIAINSARLCCPFVYIVKAQVMIPETLKAHVRERDDMMQALCWMIIASVSIPGGLFYPAYSAIAGDLDLTDTRSAMEYTVIPILLFHCA